MQAREAYIIGDMAGNVRARQLVDEAMTLDPQYALAYMFMGTIHNQAFLIGSSKSPRDSLMQGIEWLQKALAMDDSLAEAHARLGHSYTFVQRHDEAVAEAEKAMAMDPNSAAVHFMACLVLRFSGKPAESIPVCKKSIRLEPVTPGMFGYSLLRANANRAYFNALMDAVATAPGTVAVYGCVSTTKPQRSATLGHLLQLSLTGSPTIDFVITVCDNAAAELCPVWPGQPVTAHWGVDDPASIEGTELEKTTPFRRAFNALEHRLRLFTSLPIASLDRLRLGHELDAIGRSLPET